jgi:hypothetical protein
MKKYNYYGRQYDCGRSGNIEYQDSKFRDPDAKAIKPETRDYPVDPAFTALNPKWCDSCGVKIACHHQEV